MLLAVIGLFCLTSFIDGKMISKRGEFHEWEQHKDKHALKFHEADEHHHRGIFYENLAFVKKHNAKNAGYTVDINQFGHLKHSETKRCFLGQRPGQTRKSTKKVLGGSTLPIPNSMDWRKKGYVSSVKDQGQCGSCYAFSGIDAVESHWAIDSGLPIVDLSEQEIVDCSFTEGDQGCNGGYIDTVFQYIEKHGISTLKDYSYDAHEGKCKASRVRHSYKVLTHVDVHEGSEDALVRALAFHGPVSIAIDASSLEFRFYKSGVFKLSNCSSVYLDHAVLAVGYELGDDPYIIVKNSWGPDWGENGYIKMALFKNNQCGIASSASYPIPKA